MSKSFAEKDKKTWTDHGVIAIVILILCSFLITVYQHIKYIRHQSISQSTINHSNSQSSMPSNSVLLQISEPVPSITRNTTENQPSTSTNNDAKIINHPPIEELFVPPSQRRSR